jgi:hypothetical protein
MTRSSLPSAPLGPNFTDVGLVPLRARPEIVWLLIVFAIGGDIAAFYVVLARLFLGQPIIILAATLGFAAIAVGLSHMIGRGLRRRRAGDRARSDGLLVLWAAAWLVLGAAAFAGRMWFGPVISTSGFGPAEADVTSLRDVLAAAVFAGLYIGSGLLAMGAAYAAYNPAARAYRQASKNLRVAWEKQRACEGALARLERQHADLVADLHQAPRRRELDRITTHNDTVGLKITARHLMAASVRDDDGRVLVLFMIDSPSPRAYPEDEKA